MILIGIGLLLLVCSIFANKSRNLYVIQVVYMWLVASFNTDNPDYFHYWNGYTHIKGYAGNISEPLYWAVAKFTHAIGLDFQGFRCVVFAIALLALSYAIWKLTNKPNLLLGIYFIYPFTVDVVQMRGMVANAFVMVAILLLITYKEKAKGKYLLMSFAMVVLATGFHYSAASAAIIYLALVSKKNIEKAIIYCGIALVAVAGVFVAFYSKIMSAVLGAGVVDKFSGYQETGTNVGGFILSLFALQWLFVFICYFGLHGPKVEGFDYESSVWTKNSFMFKIVVLNTCLAISEVLISMELERITRVGTLIGFCMLCNIAEHNEAEHKNIIRLAGLAYVLMSFFVLMFIHQSDVGLWFDYTFMSVFENNII